MWLALVLDVLVTKLMPVQTTLEVSMHPSIRVIKLNFVRSEY